MPYITASIILQLMTVVWPYLERLQKEGELGRRKITQYTRYLDDPSQHRFSHSRSLPHWKKPEGRGKSALVYNPGICVRADDDSDAH